MTHGFLGYRTTFMLDFVVCALVVVVPVLLYSLYVVKVHCDYARHRNLQVLLGAVLLAAVTAFEVDVQLIHGGWENVVNPPGEPARLVPAALAEVRRILGVHLVFAISTPFLWGATLALAWRRFARPPAPGLHSRLHKPLGWIAALDLIATSVTGLWFYYAAFIAPRGG